MKAFIIPYRKALLILLVDFRSRRSLTTGGSGASSALLRLHIRSNHHWVIINIEL
jgi:hypothetical protein